MSCKSVLYAVNTNAQSMTTGDAINFGNVVRRYGCQCNLVSGNPVLTGSGYYDIDTNVTLTASAAGTATVTLYKDGVAIPGAVSSFTVAAGVYTLNLGAIVRNICNASSTITAVFTGVDSSVSEASIKVVKL